MFGFIGNRVIYDFFSKIEANNQLAHAYGFSGPSQVGKRALANIVAGRLLGVSPEALVSNPDFYLVERVINEKTGKLQKDISVEQARDLKDILLRRPWLGGYQVIVIDEVEHLNNASANSLLKFLEEPSGKSVIFIITQDEGRLLATVRSRCQWWQFGAVSKQQITDGLIANQINGQIARDVADWAWGMPGRAVELALDAQKLDQVKEEVLRYEKLRLAPVYERFKIIEGLAGEKKGATRGRDELDEILRIWIMAERQMMLSKNNSASSESVGLIGRIAQLRNYLAQNIHPRLALEEFVLSF